jgi:AraC-like DNA-binding protein
MRLESEEPFEIALGNQFDFLSIKSLFKTRSTDKLHYHKLYQLLTIWNGVSVLETKNSKKLLYSDLAVLIPPGIAHRSTVVGDMAGYECIYFESRIPDIGYDEVIVFKTSGLFKELFSTLCEKTLTELGDKIDSEMFSLLLKLLKAEIKNTPSLVTLPAPKGEVSRGVCAYIEENYTENITIDDIVSNIAYVKRHVHRLFKKETSLTITSYLKLYRIMMSTMCLFDKEKNISECAYNCGYISLTSFYKDFKILTGKSPGDFRKSL